MKKLFMTVLLLCVAHYSSASDLRLKVSVQPERAVLAEPVELIISLSGDANFTLPAKFGPCDGGRTRLIILDRAGQPAQAASPEPPCPQVLPPPCDSLAMYPTYCDLATARYHIVLPIGAYSIRVEYESSGPYYDRGCGPGRNLAKNVWVGKLVSNTVPLVIDPPRGADAEALRALIQREEQKPQLQQYAFFLAAHGGELLSRFSSSTYAAYVVWEHTDAKGIAESNPANVVKAIETGLILRSEMPISCPDASGKLAFCRCTGREAVSCRAYWYALILKNHSDVWFADDLRLRSAIDQCTLQNYQTAQGELEAIAKDDKAPMAPKAKEYLGLMKQKGWIKE